MAPVLLTNWGKIDKLRRAEIDKLRRAEITTLKVNNILTYFNTLLQIYVYVAH